MRIDGLGRTVSGGGSTTRSGATGGFRILDPSSAEAPRQTAPLRAAPQLDALIALQAIPEDTPQERRRKQIKRGHSMLDALDGLKLAMLDGHADPQALSALARDIGERREQSGDAGLDDALSAIELRVQVELAKRGR